MLANHCQRFYSKTGNWKRRRLLHSNWKAQWCSNLVLVTTQDEMRQNLLILTSIAVYIATKEQQKPNYYIFAPNNNGNHINGDLDTLFKI